MWDDERNLWDLECTGNKTNTKERGENTNTWKKGLFSLQHHKQDAD